MKKLYNAIIVVATLVSTTASMYGADCAVPLTVAQMPQYEEVPAKVMSALEENLRRIVTSSGAMTGTEDTPFFISGRFSHSMDETLPGPPRQFSLNTTLTIYIGNAESQTLFGSCELELSGVGHSKQQAFVNAMRYVNSKNKEVKTLLAAASDKVIAYYDANASQILAKARKAAATQNYEEALYYAFSIPECCRAYGKAVEEGLRYYKQYIDADGRKIFERARALWSAQQDAQGAKDALAMLVHIPVGSSVYPEAEKLAAEIHAVVKDDKKFETRRKYEDAVDLRKAEIGAAREVGVAWGRGQQPKTTNIAWIK